MNSNFDAHLEPLYEAYHTVYLHQKVNYKKLKVNQLSNSEDPYLWHTEVFLSKLPNLMTNAILLITIEEWKLEDLTPTKI